MIWIGAILGALFGWAGILVAAGAWLLFAVAKLLYLVIVFTAQLAIAVVAITVQLVAWVVRWITGKRTGSTPAAR